MKPSDEEHKRQERERLQAMKKFPPMSDKDFWELCNYGYASKVEEVIMNSATVNAKNHNGRTALMKAMRQRHTETADLLRKYGAK